jgi:predicted nucleotidyltransferase
VDALQTVQRLREYFDLHPEGIAAVYLFGSIARSAGGPHSDLDVGVLFEHDPPSTLAGSGLGLEGELERRMGRRVDLVVLNRAPVDLVHRVLRDGLIVFDPAPLARIHFEVRSRNAYFDLKPFLDRYRRKARAAADG